MKLSQRCVDVCRILTATLNLPPEGSLRLARAKHEGKEAIPAPSEGRDPDTQSQGGARRQLTAAAGKAVRSHGARIYAGSEGTGKQHVQTERLKPCRSDQIGASATVER